MMKNYQKIIMLFALGLAGSLSGCSMFGLDLQKDYDRTPHTLDPHIYKTAWQYLKERSRGTTSTNQIFASMMDAIEYAGIDSNEYKVQGRTYIFLNAAASKAVWANVKTVKNVAATKWADYPKEDVKKYFQYLILQGVYDHYTLPPIDNMTVKTLAPEGAFTINSTGFVIPAFVSNPTSQMKIKVLNSSPSNTADYPIQFNNVVNAVTSSILATNGTIHVIGTYLTTNNPEL